MATEPITLYYCADGNRRFAEIAINPDKRYGVHNFRYGAQLPKTVYFKPEFADQDFKNPRYVDYIQALKKHRPYMASVLDIMELRRLDEYIMRAEEISQYCQVIMLIPKVHGIIQRLPKEINGKPVRLGYSVPTRFGGTTVPQKEFDDWSIHLLGGSPMEQYRLSQEMSVVSCDGNYAQLMSRYNQFFLPKFLWNKKYISKVEGGFIKNPIWPTILEFDDKKWGDGSNTADAPYEAFMRSCQNIWQMWHRD